MDQRWQQGDVIDGKWDQLTRNRLSCQWGKYETVLKYLQHELAGFTACGFLLSFLIADLDVRVVELSPNGTAFCAKKTAQRFGPAMPRKYPFARRALCPPITLRHLHSLVARSGIAAQPHAHVFPDLIVSVTDSHQSMGDFMEDGIKDHLWLIVYNVVFGQLDALDKFFADTKLPLIFVQLKIPTRQTMVVNELARQCKCFEFIHERNLGARPFDSISRGC
jgi:hypothetical protein